MLMCLISSRDFKAIAQNMGLNRTTAALKAYFSKNRQRCGLDEALQQHRHNAAMAEGREHRGEEMRVNSSFCLYKSRS